MTSQHETSDTATPMDDAARALPELGTIEGYYGRAWSWDARAETVEFLAPHGYRFFLYAPKVDVHLRRRWQEPHSSDDGAALSDLAATCRANSVRFGVGLSPFELYLNFDDDARSTLARRLDDFAELGVQDLALLFDDMRGDVPDLARLQAEIVAWVAERSSADRLFVCPSYYSDDPILDRVFGHRPAGYLEQLGELLDPDIEIFWTGEEVCSRELAPAHLRRVGETLRRKPFLWDNYPVNDGQRMSQYLHLRAFTGRPAALADVIAGHGVNPALQPTLSRIPALTLTDSYRRGAQYAYGEAFRKAASAVVGDEMAQLLYEDVLFLQDVGLDRLDKREPALRERYGNVDHPAAREIIEWLDGGYAITDEIVQTQ